MVKASPLKIVITFFTMISMEDGKISMETTIMKMGKQMKNLTPIVKKVSVKVLGTQLMMNMNVNLLQARMLNKSFKNSQFNRQYS